MIEVHIPYDHTGEKNLGRVYNEIMENARCDNVLFVDHDVYLTPRWMEVSQAVVNMDGWGWITCWTNRIGCRWQRLRGVAHTDDLAYHRAIAEIVYKQRGSGFSVADPLNWQGTVSNVEYPSGFFLLTNKRAWADVGGFEEGMFEKTDTHYGMALAKNGWDFIRMDGLYVYHYYRGRQCK